MNIGILIIMPHLPSLAYTYLLLIKYNWSLPKNWCLFINNNLSSFYNIEDHDKDGIYLLPLMNNGGYIII